MKNILKVFMLVLVVFCLVVSCSKKAGSSNNADGIEVIVSSNDGSSGSSGGGSSAAAVSSDNSLKNAVGKIKHDKDDVIFNSWAEIEWADFGLSAAPAEPSGGKLETAYISNKMPYIIISNVSRAAYEKLCREMEAGFNKEGEFYGSSWGGYLLDLGLDACDERFDIPLGYSFESVELHLGDDFGNDIRVYEDYGLTTEYTFRIYYYDSPINGVIMTVFSESIM